jgi:antitoxin component of MazEF toxin-antitoxin module
MESGMNTATLRSWGGAVAVSLPKKVLAALGLGAGAEVVVKIEGSNIVLSPARKRFTLGQLEKEQRALERAAGGPSASEDWFSSPSQGRELL